MKSYFQLLHTSKYFMLNAKSFMVHLLNYWSTINPNWKPKFPCPCFNSALWTEFQAKCDFCKGLLSSWPDTLVAYLCCRVTVTWHRIFSFFFFIPLQIHWVKHDGSIIILLSTAETPNFPMIEILLYCKDLLAFGNSSKRMEGRMAERDFSCVF